jgi:AraC-like DNA-binding protein
MVAVPTRKTAAMLSLSDLILTLKGDRTYEQLEAASGGVVRAQRFAQVAAGIRVNEFPKPATIEAMADALGCDVTVLLMAFARAVGLDVHARDSGFVDLLPPSVDDLSEQQQAFLLSTIRAMQGDQAPPRRRGRGGRPPLF